MMINKMTLNDLIVSFEDSQAFVGQLIDDLLALLPSSEQLPASRRRGIIARYSSVLEGNFIYWMAGAYIAARSDEGRNIICNNLLEEIRDAHPLMLRKFAIAAGALPTDTDTLAVDPQLSQVRLFIGQLSAVPILLMMAFFESFIQRFMPYLQDLAAREGSGEREYTDVHGICDVHHSQELLRALRAEIPLLSDCVRVDNDPYEGVFLLRDLIRSILIGDSSPVPA